MIYELIYNELLTIINIDLAPWLLKSVEILSLILTILFIMIFLSIPFYIFKGFFSLLSFEEPKRKKKTWL